MATRSTVNKQIRSFAFVWTGITLTIGIAVFFAIYLTYDADNNVAAAGSDDVSLPSSAETKDQQAAAAEDEDTPEVTPVSTGEPATNTPQIVAQSAGEDAAAASAGEPGERQSTPLAVTPLSAVGGESGEAAQQQTQPTATSQPTATELPVNTKDEFIVGVQVQASPDLNPDTQRIWMEDVDKLNLEWIKMQVRWEEVEPEPDQYDWRKLDMALPLAQEYGYEVVLSVVAAPNWARPEGVNMEEEGPPTDYGEFTQFLRDMLNRYPDMIHAVEIWNEPNIDREWSAPNGLDASRYVDLLRQSYNTIKEIDPGIIVISGALSPTGGFVDSNGVVRAIDDFDFMDQLINANMLEYADCVGVHHNGYNVSPQYTWDNIPNDPDAEFRGPFDNPHHSWSFRSTVQTYANKIAVAGGDQKLCITEFGWPSTEDLDGTPQNFEFANDNTLEEQSEYTVQALNLMEEWGTVWIATIWNLNYGPQAGWSTESDNTPYSMIGPGFSRRPVFDAVAEWAEQDN